MLTENSIQNSIQNTVRRVVVETGCSKLSILFLKVVPKGLNLSIDLSF